MNYIILYIYYKILFFIIQHEISEEVLAEGSGLYACFCQGG